jgi:gliding motility-associated-like protein
MVASNGICDDFWTDSIKVTPPLEVFVPNVFSPNADGTNDGYTIFTRNALTIDAIIVNRWGDVMVKITNVNYKWDGKTANGNDATEGVYFIKYKVTGSANQEQSGQTFFHLIR